jgi:hypothetical protein
MDISECRLLRVFKAIPYLIFCSNVRRLIVSFGYLLFGLHHYLVGLVGEED